MGDASKFKGHCIGHKKIKTYYYVYLKYIWYHNGGYFQVIFYDRSLFFAGKKIEHGANEGQKWDCDTS